MMKIIGGDFLIYILVLDNKIFFEYKELKYEIIFVVRICIEFNGYCLIVVLILVNCIVEVFILMFLIILIYR